MWRRLPWRETFHAGAGNGSETTSADSRGATTAYAAVRLVVIGRCRERLAPGSRAHARLAYFHWDIPYFVASAVLGWHCVSLGLPVCGNVTPNPISPADSPPTTHFIAPSQYFSCLTHSLILRRLPNAEYVLVLFQNYEPLVVEGDFSDSVDIETDAGADLGFCPLILRVLVQIV